MTFRPGRVLRATALFVALAVAAGACSLPTDDQAEPIDQQRLDESLRRVTTTTTTSTLPPVQTRDFAYYLLTNVAEGQRRVQQVVAQVPADSSLFEILDPMAEEGFRASLGVDENLLINTVRAYDIVGVETEDGVATVMLETINDPPDSVVLRDVAAQLVWTLTGEPDIDAILIVINGEPQELPTTNEENLTSEPVDRTDYAAYDAEIDQTTSTTSSTSTTTTTTVPPGN